MILELVISVVVWIVLAAAILREQKVLKKMRESGELRDEPDRNRPGRS